MSGWITWSTDPAAAASSSGPRKFSPPASRIGAEAASSSQAAAGASTRSGSSSQWRSNPATARHNSFARPSVRAWLAWTARMTSGPERCPHRLDIAPNQIGSKPDLQLERAMAFGLLCSRETLGRIRVDARDVDRDRLDRPGTSARSAARSACGRQNPIPQCRCQPEPVRSGQSLLSAAR